MFFSPKEIAEAALSIVKEKRHQLKKTEKSHHGEEQKLTLDGAELKSLT